MKAPLITIENLCMDFNGKGVLKNISFEISEGEILGIIGRSGAGKTVLMHLMRGVEQPPPSAAGVRTSISGVQPGSHARIAAVP
jgi:methyl coenzyme M reductase system subunit A2